jgi:hypothetical protein
MSAQVFDRAKLLKLAAWAQLTPSKRAFVDPAAAAGAIPPGGAPPMDPMMMGGAPPMPGGGPPMDPAAMGGIPPVAGGMPAGDPMLAVPPEAAPPPPDPSTQAMGDQEAVRTMIREEVQKALGTGEGGVATGTKKGGNKMEDALRVLEDKMSDHTKIIVAALRNAGIEISVGDVLGINQADGNGTAAGTPATSSKGVSETLQPGLGGDAAGGQSGKIASITPMEEQINQLTKLAATKDHLQRSALASKLTPSDPQEKGLSYLSGLFR